MRVEYIHTATGAMSAVDLPDLLNPVRIGHHPRNHVVLPESSVGLEAIVLENDIAGGKGWRLWNRNGQAITVDGLVIAERNQCLKLADRRVTVQCPPFSLTLIFAAADIATEADELERLERDCSEMIRTIHRALVEIHPNDSLEPGQTQVDGYVHMLEREIIDLAARSDDFPASDRVSTTLGNHLAGVAIRSRVIRHLVAIDSRWASSARPEANWKRYRSGIPEVEDLLHRLVMTVSEELELTTPTDLSSRIDRLQHGFWSLWKRWLSAGVIESRVARYAALGRMVKEVKDIWYGFGPLEDLLEDPSITEIMVLDADRIFIEKNNRIERSGRRFLSDPLTIAQRILSQANRQINAAQPLADARMPDGSRVNVIIPPLALNGPTITIRRFPPHRLTMDQLVDPIGALTASACAFLRATVINRRNIVVSGGTGTGKTTMLNCLSQFIPPKERIVTIEDTAELQIQRDHVVTLQARPKGIEGTGLISIRDLVRNALRMRPDRIVVGECRGGEAIDMLQAMNTGHDGSMTTLHANNAQAAIDRLVVLVQQDADTELPVGTILDQIVSAVDVIVQLGEQIVDGQRRKVVQEISEVREHDVDAGAVRLSPLFRRLGDGELHPTGHMPSFMPALIERGLVPDPLAFMRSADHWGAKS